MGIMKRAFTLDNPIGWITLGVVALLAAPPVRRALRAATVSGAVGVLKLGDGLKDASTKAIEQGKGIFEDAVQKREEWREAAGKAEQSWVRRSVVNGVATSMSTAEAVAQGARGLMERMRGAVSSEIGVLGEDANHPIQHSAVATNSEPTRDKTAGSALVNMLPDDLLPDTTATRYTSQGFTSHQVPPDFAVRNMEALKELAADADQVGVTLKPEYKRMIDLVDRAPNE